jgi:regulator of sigma E protease
VQTLISFVFVLGVLIFVHELGHFLMARRIGVRVLTFSLGFGPKLLKFTRGDTEYCVSAIPLGGYVKMAGENPEDTRTGASDEFMSKTKWQRFQVLVMGPVMNIVLALVVMAVVLYQGAPVPAYDKHPAVIGGFIEQSVARDAGLQVNDRIVAVDGEPVADWEDFMMEIIPKANRQVTLRIERNGATLDKPLTPAAQGKFEIGTIGIKPVQNPQVAALVPGEAAAAAGLQAGDVIVEAAGERDASYERVLELIKAYGGKPLPLRIRRGSDILPVEVTPRLTADTVRIGATITSIEYRYADPTPLEAVKLSAIQNWEWTKLILKTLKGLFTRDTPMKQLIGPVGIAEMSGGAAQAGWLALFGFMAMISLNLGLINLMPIPVLDGGHILILALEGVSRRDFSMQVKEKMLLVGFVLLLTLMVTVIYNDLARVEWIQKMMVWRS